MSIKIMNKVWLSKLTSTQKLVLLSLADNADDFGSCFPLIETIAKKCSLSVRSVYGQLKKLEELQILTHQTRKYRSSIYKINEANIQISKPEKGMLMSDAPNQMQHLASATSAKNTATSSNNTATGAKNTATGSPITNTESPRNLLTKKVEEAVRPPEGVNDELWTDFKAVFKFKNKLLTSTTLRKIEAVSEKCGTAPAEIIFMMVSNSWVSVEAEWITNKQKQFSKKQSQSPLDDMSTDEYRAHMWKELGIGAINEENNVSDCDTKINSYGDGGFEPPHDYFQEDHKRKMLIELGMLKPEEFCSARLTVDME